MGGHSSAVEPLQASVPDGREVPDGTPSMAASPTAEKSKRSIEFGVTLLLGQASSQWQWLHTRSGTWKDYDPASNRKLERAFQAGMTKTRIKTGKNLDVPYMVSFTDMKQFDVKTRNERDLQRVGKDTYVQKAQRIARRMLRWAHSGFQVDDFQTWLQNHDDLAKNPCGDDLGLDHDTVSDEGGRVSLQSLAAGIVQSEWWFGTSMLLIFMNAMWTWISADNYPGITLINLPLGFQVVEYVFAAWFTLELVVRFVSFDRKLHTLFDFWFVTDFILIVVTYLQIWMKQLNLGAGILRVFRLCRLVRWIPDLWILVKSILIGLRAVAATIFMLFLVLFVAGVLFQFLNYMDGYEGLRKKKHFRTIGWAMWNLWWKGLLGDEISVFAQDIFDGGGLSAVVYFTIFVFVEVFLILNMLIGLQCEIVAEVSAAEKAIFSIRTLKRSLHEVLMVYSGTGGHGERDLTKEEFQMVLQDPDFHLVLDRFGTNLSEPSVREVFIISAANMFQFKQGQGEVIAFNALLSILIRLKDENSCRVSDIVAMQENLKRRLDQMTDGAATKADMYAMSLAAPDAVALPKPLFRSEALREATSGGV